MATSLHTPSAYDNRLWAGASDGELLAHMTAERQRLENDDALLPHVLDSQGPLLDYGCGPGFASGGMIGVDAYAFDPSAVMRESAARFLPPQHVFQRVEEIPRDTFRRIWCCLVLCIVDEDAVREALDVCRSAITDDGRALFTICNPKLFDEARTRLDLRFPEGLSPDNACILPKWKLESAPYAQGNRNGYGVYERHRPTESYEVFMKDSGFDVNMLIETPHYELAGKTIPGDFLAFQCTPS